MSTVGNIVGIQAQEIAKVAEKYAIISISETEVNSFCMEYILQYYVIDYIIIINSVLLL